MYDLRKLGTGAGAAGVAALTMALLSSTSAYAQAGGYLFTSSVVTYATQAVAGANGALTIPPNSVALAGAGVTASTPGSFAVTFTLPSGVSFSSNPAATGDGVVFGTGTLTGGGSGSNTVTYSVPTTGAAGTGTLTLGLFTIAGATSLTTPTTSASTSSQGFVIKEQVTGLGGGYAAGGGTTQASASSTGLAASANALTVTVVRNPVAAVIDTTSTALNSAGQLALGKVLTTGTAIANSNGLGYNLGTIFNTVTPGTVAADGLSNFSFGAATATVLISGNFSGISAIYADPTNAACKSTSTGEAGIGGVITGTISSGAATFSGVKISSTGVTICEYANGTAIIGANPSGPGLLTTISGGSKTGSSQLGASSYASTTPYYVTYTGNNGSYPTFLRVVNNSGANIDVYADVQGDDGTEGSTQVESALAAGRNDLAAVSTIMSSAGVSPATQRASLVVFVSPTGSPNNAGSSNFGSGSVGISHIMLNPNGTVVQMGGNNSP